MDEKNGESIYGTRGGPFKPADYGSSTRKGDTVYVHILKWPDGPLKLPNIQARILLAKILGGGSAAFKQTESSIEISVPPEDRDPSDTVVALKLDSPAMKIPAVEVTKPAIAPVNPKNCIRSWMPAP